MERRKIKRCKLEKKAIFDNVMENRYELTYFFPDTKDKSILVIALNPASDDIQITDSTTNYILNNLLPMGYNTITICNLYSVICNKLRPKEVENNDYNIEYIKDVITRKFNTILIAYGNNYQNSKLVQNEKGKLDGVLQEMGVKAVELVDMEDIYSRLHTIHPLFAGQRFSGKWKFRKYIINSKTINKSDNMKKIKKDDEKNDTKVLDNKTTAKSA